MSNRLTKEDLRDEMRFMGGLIISTREILRNFELISKYDNEDKFSSNYGGFLIHYMTLGWSQCSINLCKLLKENDNEKRSFIKLLNKLENRRYDSSINEILKENKSLNKSNTAKSHEDIKDIVSKCKEKIVENNELITRISNRRNNVYAHGYSPKGKDPNLFTVETRKELNKLVDLSFYIFDQIFGEIFGTSWPAETKLHSIEPILKSIQSKN